MVAVVFWFFTEKGRVSYRRNKNLSQDFLTGEVYGMPIYRTALCQHCSVAFIQITFSEKALWTLDHP